MIDQGVRTSVAVCWPRLKAELARRTKLQHEAVRMADGAMEAANARLRELSGDAADGMDERAELRGQVKMLQNQLELHQKRVALGRDDKSKLELYDRLEKVVTGAGYDMQEMPTKMKQIFDWLEDPLSFPELEVSELSFEDPLGDQQPEEEPDLTVRAATADTEGTTVSVRGKPWEVIRIEGDRVFLKLVNGTMKKQFPLAKVQEALRSGGYI